MRYVGIDDSYNADDVKTQTTERQGVLFPWVALTASELHILLKHNFICNSATSAP